jgi:fumarate reductase flavoprotein subunit
MRRADGRWDVGADVVVVGAGGCGLAAGLAASANGAQVLVLEKSVKPLSNTARSGGMIPAAGSRLQRAAGIVENPADLAADILRKSRGTADRATVEHLARTALLVVNWLIDDIGVALEFVADFKYPGHSQCRMHAPPNRTGQALVDDLRAALNRRSNADLVHGAEVADLIVTAGPEGDEVAGVLVAQGAEQMAVRARKLILACNGFAGNRDMVARHCPQIGNALYFGGEGSTGEGIRWGQELGGAVAFMDAYQGHATVAVPHAVLITYAVIMEGGVLVNRCGQRFGDETVGYSEYALRLLAQPDGVAWAIYDQRIHELALRFADYRDAMAVGAIKSGRAPEQLARALDVDSRTLASTLARYHSAAAHRQPDEFGRADTRQLGKPLYGVRVTGALFHTQGGLVVDRHARVLRADGRVVPHLYAGGGVAAGISGHGAGGYLSGNGLLTALGYGMLAGRHAAHAIGQQPQGSLWPPCTFCPGASPSRSATTTSSTCPTGPFPPPTATMTSTTR